MDRLKILKAARAKITKPERWTKGEIARNAAGKEVSPRSKEAVCWCALGALQAAAGKKCSFIEIDDLAYELTPRWTWIAKVNDHKDTTHADILALFDRAIAAEKAKVLA